MVVTTDELGRAELRDPGKALELTVELTPPVPLRDVLEPGGAEELTCVIELGPVWIVDDDEAVVDSVVGVVEEDDGGASGADMCRIPGNDFATAIASGSHA